MSEHNLFEGLTAVVQYRLKDGMDAWNTLAAFDLEPVADEYAKRCGGENVPWEYRVVPITPASL